MLQLNCPFCGLRDEAEFSCGGEAHIARPLARNQLSDKDFADYLFMRDNPKGVFLERWCHVCLLYTSPSPRDPKSSRMPSSA